MQQCLRENVYLPESSHEVLNAPFDSAFCHIHPAMQPTAPLWHQKLTAHKVQISSKLRKLEDSTMFCHTFLQGQKPL